MLQTKQRVLRGGNIMTMMAIFKNHENGELRKLTKNNGKVYYEGINAKDERTIDTYTILTFEEAMMALIKGGFTLEFIG